MELAPPNRAGIRMGHVHLMVSDTAAVRHAFLKLGGGLVRNLGSFEIIPFPGAYILLTNRESLGGSVASVVSSVSFHVRSLQTIVDTCQEARIKIARSESESQCWINMPGDVVVELLELPNLSYPIQFHAINFSSRDTEAMATWYGRFLGGEIIPGAGELVTVKIPGAELRLEKKNSAGLPTKGRSLDHVGFDVNDLGQLYEKYSASGVEFESPPRVAPNGITRVAFCNDPWGTRIELTEKISALL